MQPLTPLHRTRDLSGQRLWGGTEGGRGEEREQKKCRAWKTQLNVTLTADGATRTALPPWAMAAQPYGPGVVGAFYAPLFLQVLAAGRSAGIAAGQLAEDKETNKKEHDRVDGNLESKHGVAGSGWQGRPRNRLRAIASYGSAVAGELNQSCFAKQPW